MRPAGLRALVVVAVAVAAVGVGLWASQGSASAQAPAAGTITTELRPGWNVIGWLGSDTTTRELFDAIPELNLIVAWDGEAQRHRWAWRPAIGSRGLQEIGRGRGLALHIGGESAVEWTRPAADGVVLLRLHAGHNLVTWGGPDGTPIDEALDWLGDAVVGASRWNADTRASDRYRPGAPPAANTLRTLNHGDALWVRLSEDARWWQSGTAGTEFIFKESVPAETQLEIREETARVLAFYAERYGIEPPPFVVLVDPGLDISGDARAGRIRLGEHAIDQPRREFILAHEYFHILQHQLGNQAPSADGSPAWLTEGTARYVQDLYGREREGGTGDAARAHWWRRSLEVSAPLSALEAPEALAVPGFATYDLGALAVDWLVRRVAAASGNVPFAPHALGGLELRSEWDAHLQYYRLRESLGSWQAAFAEAFGVAVDEFYAEFAEYRAELTAARLPHLADDLDEPLLVFVGEVFPRRAVRFQTEFRNLLAFFRDRFGGGPADYTLFFAADHQSAAATDRALGGTGRVLCGSWGRDVVLLLLPCNSSFPVHLATYHSVAVMRRLAPLELLSQRTGDPTPRSPEWLQRGTVKYVDSAYRATTGHTIFARVRGELIGVAREVTGPLSTIESAASWNALGRRRAGALSFLAADWLVERAGEPALFEYYRLLPSSDTWREAFEGAFGITIDDFYDEFAKYRAAGFDS